MPVVFKEAIVTPEEATKVGEAPNVNRRPGRVLKLGCLMVLLGLCGGLGALALALQSGPVTLGLPGDNVLKVGSDDFVLSNSSFQNGMTYFLDFNGNDVRHILQLHYLADSKTLEFVLHHASEEEMSERRLITIPWR